MSEHTYQFNVKMHCSGCSGAVERALSKLDGVSSYETSLEKQEVIVKGTAEYETVLEKIQKTGKQVLGGQTLD
ncbi:heavy metal transport/detoxification protein [Calocera viscosa TUFC12733]|uniref:Heavy metal transport/detoxification protein n=1 Tax=Calocera viscosa (strain TUFC12733) TaxID=1330018 RepID=A0A167LMG9_CALVF|nr:heavy metal transport/detoxification protein [Calocera viscosa TUFC12733]